MSETVGTQLMRASIAAGLLVLSSCSTPPNSPAAVLRAGSDPVSSEEVERITRFLDGLPYVETLGRRLTAEEVTDPRIVGKSSPGGIVTFEVIFERHGS